MRLVEVAFSLSFPERCPALTLAEFPGPRSWRLDAAQCPHSPRWSPARMAEELVRFALTANPLAWA